MLIVWAAFLARHKPVSTMAKPTCMNITKKPASSNPTVFMIKRLSVFYAVAGF